MLMVDLESVIVRSASTLGAELDGVIILMSIENGEYYKLSETSIAVWTLIEKPISISDLCKILTSRYDVEESQVQSDVQEFINYLQELKLVALYRPGADFVACGSGDSLEATM